jgi:hypothetical protein
VIDGATRFAAVAIYNNAKGPDAEVLKKFKEAAWNNPVVRYLDADEKDLVPKLARDWNARNVLSKMVEALEKAKQDVPAYLKLAAGEEKPPGPDARDPLEGSPAYYYYLPLTRLQSEKVAEALAAKQDAAPLLSPTQLALKDSVKKTLDRSPDSLKALKPVRALESLPAYTAELRKALGGAHESRGRTQMFR